MVGPVVVAEAADDRVGLLDLDADREGAVAEQSGERVEVLPDRGSARAHQELLRREPSEVTAQEVEALGVPDDPGLLFAQAEPPRREELPHHGEDDPF